MSKLILGLGCAVVVAVARPTGVGAQASTPLNSADSAAIFFTALDSVRQSMWRPFGEDAVIWLRGRRDSPVETPSAAVMSELRQHFPSLEFVSSSADLFECPPGLQVQMPGQGCPIRDGGRIVSFGAPEQDPSGNVTLWLFVTHSSEDAAWTQLFGRQLRLTRDARGGWRILEFLQTLVT